MGSGVKRFRQQTGLTQRSELGSLAPSEGPEIGVLEFRNVSEDYVVKSGLESQWTTLAPE
jgi:hypothetical protein